MGIKGRSFLSTQDFDAAEIDAILTRAKAFKHAPALPKPLAGKRVALIFFNPSLRTRVSFELAISELGGTPVSMNVGSDSWTLEHRDGVVMNEGKTEHIKDAARVLSRYVHAIGVRCFATMERQEEDMADAVISSFRKYSEVPVINLESALYHPGQALADAMTIIERRGGMKGLPVTLTWAPHPRPLPTAVPNSFLLMATQLGADVTLAHPKEFPLPARVMELAERNAKETGRRLRVVDNQPEAFLKSQIVYAKSWGSLAHYGKWSEEAKVRQAHSSWIIDDLKMKNTNGALFMHCLPVRRNVEVADAVLDSRQSAIYDEAENRLWVQMAMLEAII